MVVFPLLSLGISILVSFSFFVPFAEYLLNTNELAATFMFFISMALSIDYSLFLLYRFTKERRIGKPVEESVSTMLSYSGHVVILSGIVLILCYLGLGFFPVSGMNTAGYGAISSICFCIIVSCTFTPAAILQFDNFFGKIEIIPLCMFEAILGCIRICCNENRCERLQDYYYKNRIGYTDKKNTTNNKYNKHNNNGNDNYIKQGSMKELNKHTQIERNTSTYYPNNGITGARYDSAAMENDMSMRSGNRGYSQTQETRVSVSASNCHFDGKKKPQPLLSNNNNDKNSKHSQELHVRMHDDSDNSDKSDSDNDDGVREDVLEEHKTVSKCYFKMAQFVTKFPYNIIVPLVIYCAMMPVIYQLKYFDPSIDFTANFPENIDAAKAYKIITNKFNPALLNTFYILAIPGENYDDDDDDDEDGKNNTIWNKEFFNDTCNIVNKLMSDKPYGMNMNSTEFESITFEPMITETKSHTFKINTKEIECNADNVDLVYNLTHNYPNNYNIPNPTTNYHINNTIYYQLYYQAFYQTYVNPQENALLISVHINFNPWTASSKHDLSRLRNIITSNNDNNNTKFYIHSCLYWELDSLNDTYKQLWKVGALITGAIFLIIGFAFGAVVLPFRLFICVVIPVCFIYGLVVGVYGDGWLNIFNISALSKSDCGVSWPLPVMTMTILIGLAMDYEIFLFSKISEYRKKLNYNDRASIILGVASTGPVISSAGILMSLAFVGLLLENVPTFNQMGFVMVCGVLVDTFIIRPLLVPSLLSLGGWINFWPSKLIKTGLKNEYGQVEIESC